VLKLATRFEMNEARSWAITHLDSETQNIHPCLKLELAQKYRIDHWVESAFRDLVSCNLTSLSGENAYKIGQRKLLALAKTKEMLREIRTTIAFSGPQLYVFQASCETPDRCHETWETLYWMRVAPKLLHPTHPIMLTDIPHVILGWENEGICDKCYTLTQLKVKDARVLFEDERILAVVVEKLMEIQKSS
jgi:hypothetical protein